MILGRGTLGAAAALSAALLTAPAVMATGGEPREDKLKIRTALMPRAVKVRLWLPAGAEEAAPRSLPLLIFLHDGAGSQRSFTRWGLDAQLADAIARGELPPLAVASPRTWGTFNSNDASGTRRMEDFLATELVPGLLQRYPVLRDDRAGRGVTGFSLGGYGAVKLALKHPDLFGSASGMSTWVEDLSFAYMQDEFWLIRQFLKRWFGRTEETSTLARESLFNIIPEASPGPGGFPPLLLISGDKDPWVTNGNHGRLAEALDAGGIDHTLRIHPGRHGWEFWREHFLEIVSFHTGVFEGRSPLDRNSGQAVPGFP